MSTGVVSMAAVLVAVAAVAVASLHVLRPVEGAVRAGDRGGPFPLNPGPKPALGRRGHVLAGNRRGGKSYVCPQDRTQAVIPPGPEVAGRAEAATLLMEDRTVEVRRGEDSLDVDADDDMDAGSGTNVSTVETGLGLRSRRYTIHLPETSPLSIAVTGSCPRKDDLADVTPRWWVQYEGRYIATGMNGTHFFRPCVQRGLYQVVVNLPDVPVDERCSYRIAYNRKGTEEFRGWPFRNLSAPSRIKVQQQQRRFETLVKWEKSKLDIHVMNYCLAVSTGRRQRSLCQALGNSVHRPACDEIAVNDFLARWPPRTERKLDPGVGTTIVCTGTRTRQTIYGMKPNVTYFVDVFAIHSQHNNVSFLLGSTQVHLNRTRPTQLIEGKVIVGKLSTLGGMSLFNFRVPKWSPNNFFKLHLTPCGGTAKVEVFKKKHHVMDPVRGVYYPRTITVRNVRPGERYLIKVTEDDDMARLRRIQVAVSSRDEFLDLPRMPTNTTITEVVPMRRCHSSTIAWYGSPEKDVTYCVYVFKLSKTQYYNNVKIPTYCELENRDVCNHPQFHNKHCFNGNDYSPLSLDIPNLMPEHYYTVFVTALSPRGRSLPYKSVRIKTAPYCLESNQILPSSRGKAAVKGFRKPAGHKRRNTAIATKNSLTERSMGTKRSRKPNQDASKRNV